MKKVTFIMMIAFLIFTTVGSQSKAFALSGRTPPANLNCYNNGSNWVLKWDTESFNNVYLYRDGVTTHTELTGNYILFTLDTTVSAQLSFSRDLTGVLDESALSTAINIAADCTGYTPTATPTPTDTATGTPTPSPTSSTAPTPTPAPTASPAPTPCPECTSLANLLACPNWSDYMGQLTNAVSAAIPPPPNWDMVADKVGNAFITKLDAYMGQVPAAPTKNEIQQNVNSSLPAVDNSSTTAANLVPQVPADFNQPLNFDLSSAPTIPITDESKPFTIAADPIANLQHDAPNTIIKPNDPKNSSGDIPNPISPTSNIPQPQVQDPINAPNVPMPTPQQSSGSTPAIPSGSTGTIPIPSIIP